jgi:hypothetical protein
LNMVYKGVYRLVGKRNGNSGRERGMDSGTTNRICLYNRY